VTPAVKNVSLHLPRGATLGIVGESGSGKSTLARCLVRLIDPDSGSIVLEGKDWAKMSRENVRRETRHIQMVFQDPFASLNPRRKAAELVAQGLIVHGTPRAQAIADAKELFSLVGLDPSSADRYPHEFSGGQRQRIGIARALAGEPKLIVGDEPVSALDVSVQAQVINLLETLKQDLGLTLIMVAHDLAVIRHMSDRVAVMYLGEIVELADVDALFDAPLHPYTQALLRAIPASSPHERRAKPALSGDLPSPTAPPSGCRFHTRCPHAKPHCAEVRPVSERLDDGRQVACHFWREIQNAGSGAPLATSVSPKLIERLAIYRERQTAQASAGD
jgi:oligopeptide/dipeptide ABC transporter ATP-binding protein